MTMVVVAEEPQKCKLYKRRWVMLFVFILCSIISYMQWITLSIIADSAVEYYGVSYEAVNWTAMVILLIFIPCIFPGVYIVNKLGIRRSLLIATFATCAAAWIKVGAVAEDRFWVYILAQVIVGIFQVICVALPAPIAAVWFGPEEVSTACALGIFGLQVGLAVGFVFPPIIVHNNGIAEALEHDLYILNITFAIACTVVLTITFLTFEEAPPTPPSFARMKSMAIGKVDFLPSLKRIMKNGSYVIILIAYGINVGVYFGISTLLNQIVLQYYPNASDDAGRIGLLIIVSGMIGAVLFGIAMDKFHRFRETTYVVFIGGFISILGFSFTLPLGIPILYAMAIPIGFFTSGIYPVGYEITAEITYPEPECTTTGLVTIVAQPIGIGFTYLYSYLFYEKGDQCANLTTAGLMLLSTVMVFFIRFDLKRRKAQETTNDTNVPEIGVI